MASASRSPAKSHLGEHNLNISTKRDAANQTLVGEQQQLKASLGVGFQIGKGDGLSPRRAARRSLKPRKSILKSFSGGSLAGDDYTGDFTNMTGYYAQLDENLTMGRQSISRRVSFAPNAHVRMFDMNEKDKANAAAAKGPPLTDPNVSHAHSRRASIQNISQIAQAPSLFKETNHTAPIRIISAAEADTDSEHDSDDDQRGIQMGHATGLPAPAPQDHDGDSDGDGEMDMDVTGVYGGVIRRQSNMGAVADDMSIVTESDGNEEKTMDFTVAIGGMLPNSPPVGAARNRSSIGYSLPQSPNSRGVRIIPGQPMDGEEDSMDMEMDETVAFGGIIRDDSIISSEGSPEQQDRERTMTFTFGDILQPVRDDTAMGMEMTVAVGGIINLPPPSPPSPVSAASHLALPDTGTPSFARPTLSSAQRSREATPKERRNAFAPSPSPYKSTTPRKSGLDTAREVAQRLSFGSTASSGGRKRGLAKDLERPQSAKKARPSPANGNVFAAGPVSPAPAPTHLSASLPASTVNRPTKSPRKSMGTLANYIGTPQRLGGHPSKSPAKSPALRRMLGERVPSGDGEDDEWDNDTPRTISLSDFLEMAGVQFMEGLPTLNKRRSSVARGILGQSYSGDREFALHEYAEAQIQSVFLNMYTWAANKMKEDIQSGQADLRETDHICNLDNPPVIREYLSASDEDKALFEMTFKAFKTNTQLKARERWYDWKTDLMAKVRPDVEELLHGMREDKQRLDTMKQQADEVLPALQARLAALQKEVEREREIVSEVAACDPNQLADLRAAIAEQSTQIAGFTTELEDSNAKLEVLEKKLGQLDEKKATFIGRINLARSRCDQYTRSDVLRIKEDFDAIQRLHLWKLDSARSDAIRMTYDEEVRLVVPRKNGLAVISSARVEKLPKPCHSAAGPLFKRRHCEDVTKGMFAMFEESVKTISQGTSALPAFVQKTGQLWASAQRLRSELGFVTMHFPTSYRLVETPSNGRALIASARIMVKSAKSRVELCFLFDQSSLAGFPGALAHVEVEAKTVYGTANPDGMKRAARATVSGITDEGYIGGLLQACVDASTAI